MNLHIKNRICFIYNVFPFSTIIPQCKQNRPRQPVRSHRNPHTNHTHSFYRLYRAYLMSYLPQFFHSLYHYPEACIDIPQRQNRYMAVPTVTSPINHAFLCILRYRKLPCLILLEFLIVDVYILHHLNELDFPKSQRKYPCFLTR